MISSEQQSIRTAAFFKPGHTVKGVKTMRQKKEMDCIRLDPEQRLCPEFDSVSIKRFAAPDHDEMGVRVVDNFPEEHIQ